MTLAVRQMAQYTKQCNKQTNKAFFKKWLITITLSVLEMCISNEEKHIPVHTNKNN